MARADKVNGLSESAVADLRLECVRVRARALASPPCDAASTRHLPALRRHGWNELEEKKRNPLLLFLSFFWGPSALLPRGSDQASAAQAVRLAQLLAPPGSRASPPRPPFAAQCRA